jgi:hypothetical protein
MKLIVALRDWANEPNITNIEREFCKVLTDLKFNVNPGRNKPNCTSGFNN